MYLNTNKKKAISYVRELLEDQQFHDEIVKVSNRHIHCRSWDDALYICTFLDTHDSRIKNYFRLDFSLNPKKKNVKIRIKQLSNRTYMRLLDESVYDQLPLECI